MQAPPILLSCYVVVFLLTIGGASALNLQRPRQMFVALMDRTIGTTVGQQVESVFIADSENHRIVQMRADTTAVERTFGSGVIGDADGYSGTAQFRRPYGVAPLYDGATTFVPTSPSSGWSSKLYGIFVADTGNNKIKLIQWRNRSPTTYEPYVTTLFSSGHPRSIDVHFAADHSDATLFVTDPSRRCVVYTSVATIRSYTPLSNPETIATCVSSNDNTPIVARDGNFDQVTLSEPWATAINADASLLFVVDAGFHSIKKAILRWNVVTKRIDRGLSIFADLYRGNADTGPLYPHDIYVDVGSTSESGTLYISLTRSNEVTAIEYIGQYVVNNVPTSVSGRRTTNILVTEPSGIVGFHNRTLLMGSSKLPFNGLTRHCCFEQGTSADWFVAHTQRYVQQVTFVKGTPPPTSVPPPTMYPTTSAPHTESPPALTMQPTPIPTNDGLPITPAPMVPSHAPNDEDSIPVVTVAIVSAAIVVVLIIVSVIVSVSACRKKQRRGEEMAQREVERGDAAVVGVPAPGHIDFRPNQQQFTDIMQAQEMQQMGMVDGEVVATPHRGGGGCHTGDEASPTSNTKLVPSSGPSPQYQQEEEEQQLDDMEPVMYQKEAPPVLPDDVAVELDMRESESSTGDPHGSSSHSAAAADDEEAFHEA